MINVFKSISRTALFKASFFAVLLATFLSFSACDLGPDPDADGARFSRRFHYYYVQDCRADAFGAYDCGAIRVLSPAMTARLRIDSDGLASLNVDGDPFYFLESEYSEDYDMVYGGYYNFYGLYQRDDELTLYKDGLTMAHWYREDMEDRVTYYFKYLPD